MLQSLLDSVSSSVIAKTWRDRFINLGERCFGKRHIRWTKMLSQCGQKPKGREKDAFFKFIKIHVDIASVMLFGGISFAGIAEWFEEYENESTTIIKTPIEEISFGTVAFIHPIHFQKLGKPMPRCTEAVLVAQYLTKSQYCFFQLICHLSVCRYIYLKLTMAPI